jgi:hypothetical protein
MPGSIRELWVYPIKGTKGVSLDEAEVDHRGLKHDRMFSVIDAKEEWMTSRGKERLQLAHVSNNIRGKILTISGAGMCGLGINLEHPERSAIERRITVKNKPIDVLEEPTASEWFSDYLQKKSRFVRMTAASVRDTDPAYSAAGTQTALTDNFPLLVTSQESLDELNQRIRAKNGEPVTMRRFRPSVVITGFRSAYENLMKIWKAGEVTIERARPCDRCVATLIHEDGSRQTHEPLRTLNEYRKVNWKLNGEDNNQVIFGEYAVNVQKNGTLRVGDEINVMEEAQDGWDRPIALTR